MPTRRRLPSAMRTTKGNFNVTSSSADTGLKAHHRKMWASGDYPSMVETFLLATGPRLVDAAGIGEGIRVLDVAAGTGNASIAAAQRGAQVTASDLTPELFDAGRARAQSEGIKIDWFEADAENLPFDDASYDVVMSSIGAMFAPHPRDVADELVRVCRPGGTIALLSWTPEGMIGALSAPWARSSAAPAGRAAAAAVGQRGSRARPVRRPRRVGHARARQPRDHRLRASPRLRGALQGPLRADDRGPKQRRQEQARKRSSTRRSTASPTSGISAREDDARFEQEYLVAVGTRA